MAIQNNTIVSPITIADVKSTIGYEGNLANICKQDTLINKWSLVKPMYCSGDSSNNEYRPIIDTINSSYKQLDGNHRTNKDVNSYRYNLAYGINIPHKADQSQLNNTSDDIMVNPSYAARLLKRPDRKDLFYKYDSNTLARCRLSDFNNYKHNSNPFFVLYYPSYDSSLSNKTLLEKYNILKSIDDNIDVCNTYDNFVEINTLTTPNIDVTLTSPYPLSDFVKSFFLKNTSSYNNYTAYIVFYLCLLDGYLPSTDSSAFWSSYAIRKNSNGVFDWSVTSGAYETWSCFNTYSTTYFYTRMLIYELNNSTSQSFNFKAILGTYNSYKYWELIPVLFIKENSEVETVQVAQYGWNKKMNNIVFATSSDNNNFTSTQISFSSDIHTDECLFPPVGLRRLFKSVSHVEAGWFELHNKSNGAGNNKDTYPEIWAVINNHTIYNYEDRSHRLTKADLDYPLNNNIAIHLYSYNYKPDSSVNWCYKGNNNTYTSDLKIKIVLICEVNVNNDSQNSGYISFGKLAKSVKSVSSQLVQETDMLSKWSATVMTYDAVVPNKSSQSAAFSSINNGDGVVIGGTYHQNCLDILFEPPAGSNIIINKRAPFVLYIYTSKSSDANTPSWLTNETNTLDSFTNIMNALQQYTNATQSITCELPTDDTYFS